MNSSWHNPCTDFCWIWFTLTWVIANCLKLIFRIFLSRALVYWLWNGFIFVGTYFRRLNKSHTFVGFRIRCYNMFLHSSYRKFLFRRSTKTTKLVPHENKAIHSIWICLDVRTSLSFFEILTWNILYMNLSWRNTDSLTFVEFDILLKKYCPYGK